MSQDKGILKNLVIYSSGQYVVQALNFLKGLWIAKLLDPALFGLYGLLTLAVQYGPFLDLGISFSSTLELSQAKGRNDSARFKAIQGNTLSFTLLLYGLLSLSAFIGIATLGSQLSSDQITGAVVIILVVFLQQIQNYQIVYWRSLKQFSSVTLSNLIISLVSFAIIILFGPSYRLQAVFAALFLSFAAAIFLTPGSKEMWHIDWDRNVVRLLLRAGIGLLVMNVLTFAFNSIDRLVIAKFYDRETLGHFNFAFYLMNGASLIPTALTVVMIPYFIESKGANRETSYFEELLHKLTRYLAIVMPLIFLGFTAITEIAVPRFYPKYEPSMHLVLPLAGLFYIQLLTSNSANYLLAAGRQRLLTLIFLAGVVLRAGGEVLLCQLHVPALGIVAAATLVALVTSLTVFTSAERLIGQSWTQIQITLKSTLCRALPMLGLIALAYLRPVHLPGQFIVFGIYGIWFVRDILKHDRKVIDQLRQRLA